MRTNGGNTVQLSIFFKFFDLQMFLLKQILFVAICITFIIIIKLYYIILINLRTKHTEYLKAKSSRKWIYKVHRILAETRLDDKLEKLC